MSVGQELNVLQVSRALGIPYSDIYETIRFHAVKFIPVRKERGKLLVPADSLPLLLEIHQRRKNPKVPNGWVKVSDFSCRHGVKPNCVIYWARKFGILDKFHGRYYIHEDSTTETRLVLSMCKTGRPPTEWVRLMEAVRNRNLRARILRLLRIYRLPAIEVRKSVYLKRDDLEFLLEEAEVMK